MRLGMNVCLNGSRTDRDQRLLGDEATMNWNGSPAAAVLAPSVTTSMVNRACWPWHCVGLRSPSAIGGHINVVAIDSDRVACGTGFSAV